MLVNEKKQECGKLHSKFHGHAKFGEKVVNPLTMINGSKLNYILVKC